MTLGIKTKKKFYFRIYWFSAKKLEQGLKFRSEDLQEESNERKAQHNQHNQLVIQSQQMQAQQNQAIQALQQQQFRSLQ